MKLSFREIEPFVKKPNPAARVILVYGPDNGLMRERAKTMALSVVSDINDPFNAVTLSSDILSDDPARLSDEAGAISMMGGDRLVRVEDASDKITPLIKDYLENPSDSALIILEAGELGTRSSLRALCEKAKNAAAVPCYVEDERDMSRLIRESLQGAGLHAEGDAVSWLAAHITGDRQRARQEIEKLITYMGQSKSPITLGDVQACCGAAGAQNIDDLVYAVGGGNAQKALETYNLLLSEGVAFVVVLRSLQNHFRKLHAARCQYESGDNADAVVKSIKPPIFFKLAPAFKAQLERWKSPTIMRVLEKLADLEAACKQTGAPVETLCAQAVLGISASARR